MIIDMHTAYISIGSNVGNKVENIRRALAAMEKTGDIALKGGSRLYRTEPVDFTDQDWFVNAVVRVETPLAPEKLLERLGRLERDGGRVRGKVRFGPRTIDLDIIFYDALVMETEVLTLPHPRMHKRCFVLRPLCDIDPTVIHPVLKLRADELLARATEPGQEVLPLDVDENDSSPDEDRS